MTLMYVVVDDVACACPQSMRPWARFRTFLRNSDVISGDIDTSVSEVGDGPHRDESGDTCIRSLDVSRQGREGGA